MYGAQTLGMLGLGVGLVPLGFLNIPANAKTKAGAMR